MMNVEQAPSPAKSPPGAAVLPPLWKTSRFFRGISNKIQINLNIQVQKQEIETQS